MNNENVDLGDMLTHCCQFLPFHELVAVRAVNHEMLGVSNTILKSYFRENNGNNSLENRKVRANIRVHCIELKSTARIIRICRLVGQHRLLFQASSWTQPHVQIDHRHLECPVRPEQAWQRVTKICRQTTGQPDQRMICPESPEREANLTKLMIEVSSLMDSDCKDEHWDYFYDNLRGDIEKMYLPPPSPSCCERALPIILRATLIGTLVMVTLYK